MDCNVLPLRKSFLFMSNGGGEEQGIGAFCWRAYLSCHFWGYWARNQNKTFLNNSLISEHLHNICRERTRIWLEACYRAGQEREGTTVEQARQRRNHCRAGKREEEPLPRKAHFRFFTWKHWEMQHEPHERISYELERWSSWESH